MFSGLRLRLFGSYLVLLAVMLVVIGAAMVFILNTRPAPLEPAYDRLLSVAVSLPLRQIYDEAVGAGGLFVPQRNLSQLTADLQTLADERDVRLLLVQAFSRAVIYDSDGDFAQGMVLNGEFENYTIPATLGRRLPINLNAVRGTFVGREEGTTTPIDWLFVGVEAVQLRGGGDYVLLLADPRPVQTLRDALAEFGTDFLPLFVQAAVIGSGTAILLAALIARGIVRPFQQVAAAAVNAVREIKGGQSTSTRVQVRGPDEVRALAEAINQMVDEVRGEQQSQQDLLINVSHDLKTPLTSIQGYSQAIMDGAAPDAVKAATVIYDEAGRLNRMVAELTDLARLQAGRLSMRMTPIDLGALATAVAGRLSIVAQEKEIALSIEAPPMPPVAGDGDRLAQVMTNLVSNALKYTPQGGSIWVRAQPREGGVEVVVQDNGIGIPEEELPRIFERFYQVDRARGPRRGTGLGLAIVREIVQAHGGRISVMSAGKGRGSTFILWLPAIAGGTPPAPTRTQARGSVAVVGL